MFDLSIEYNISISLFNLVHGIDVGINDIAKYGNTGDIIILGDLNSRIRRLDQDITHLDIDRLDNLTARS